MALEGGTPSGEGPGVTEAGPEVDVSALRRELSRRVDGEVRFKLVSVDVARRTCVVEPGIVLDELNRQLSQRQLKFGPKPSTHSHCSLGGMIGNNSCGGSAQAYGKTVDNIRRLENLTYDGTRCWVGPTSGEDSAGARSTLPRLSHSASTVTCPSSIRRRPWTGPPFRPVPAASSRRRCSARRVRRLAAPRTS